MKGDTKVIEYLNDALRHELTAVNQYWLHYRLFENWGVNELAAKWREEAIEEMRHADSLIDRIIFLEVSSEHADARCFAYRKNPKEVVENDLQVEIVAGPFYTEAATYSHKAQDYVTHELFESLIKDEEHHIDFLETLA